jgi:ABC-type multidrug transport system ATPase subunit
MGALVLEIDELVKHYGKITAVDRLSLAIPRGAVYGILGPNGSGKTTLLGMILDVIEASGGSYSWLLSDASNPRKRIGAILETPNFYPYLSAHTNLEIVCTIKDIDPKRITEVLQQVGLLERSRDRFKTYSLGMKQRLAIASALLADPEVLILDEPTNGLDPRGIIEIRDLILRIAKQGRTIILASHLLDEVQKVCTHFCVLEFGRVIYKGLVDDFEDRKERVLLEAAFMDELKEVLKDMEHLTVERSDTDEILVQMDTNYSTEALNKDLFEKGIVLSKIEVVKHSLEAKFIEILEREL